MSVHNVIKKIYIVLTIFAVLGLLSMIPIGKYKKSYMNKRQQYQASPQMHVDATERYVEAIMDGEEDVSKGIKARAPRKYYLPFFNKELGTQRKQIKERKPRMYDKPLFVRDKSNPKNLKPYRKGLW